MSSSELPTPLRLCASVGQVIRFQPRRGDSVAPNVLEPQRHRDTEKIGFRTRWFFAFCVICISFCGARFASAEDVLPFTPTDDWQQLPDTALVETTQGAFEIELYRKEAPLSVRNFQYLVENEKYNNVKFHRYIPEFMIQGGDITGTGKGGPGYTLPPEISSVRHSYGAVGWARLPIEVNPERRSNGSQFYISLNSNHQLDGYYTVFGRVTRGMNIVEQLRVDDKIIRIRLPKEFRERRQNHSADQNTSAPPRSTTGPALPSPPVSAPPAIVRPQGEEALPPDGHLSNGDSFAIPK